MAEHHAAPNTSIIVAPIDGKREMRTYIDGWQPSFDRMLPKGLALTADRFAALAIKCIEGDPTKKLRTCTPTSLVMGFLHSAELGLEPGGPRAKAYLIPYWSRDALGKDKGANEAQFQIGVWGFKELAYRSGLVTKLHADVIYTKDKFRVLSGSGGRIIEHEPEWQLPSAERGDLVGAYSIANLSNGEQLVELVNASDLAKARAMNRGKSPAWDAWPDEMRKKVAHKRNAKSWPEGTAGMQLGEAIALDDTPGHRTLAVGREMAGQLPEAPASGGALDRLVDSRMPEVVSVAGYDVEVADDGSQVHESPNIAAQHAREREAVSPSINDEDLHTALADVDDYWSPMAMRRVISGWNEEERGAVIRWLDAPDRANLERPECMRPEREPGDEG